MRRLLAVLLLAGACSSPTKSAREPLIREKLPEWGADAFPDSDGVEWRLRDARDRGELTVVTAEPDPPRGGYKTARFVVSFAKPDAPELLACLVLDGEKWVPLFEDADAPADWRARAGL